MSSSKYYFNIIFLLLFTFSALTVKSEDSCSRIAIINHQEVLVDTGSTKKGEGLRFYLEKDPLAKKYLNEYQDRIKPKWYHAALGTTGTTLILIGLGRSGSFKGPEKTSQRAFIIGGGFLLFLNFLIIKTIEHNVERLLLHSIEEYNKRNLPKIYFTPFYRKQRRSGDESNFGITTGIIGEF